MKVALIGATGFVGTALLTELTSRGHQVTAIARNIDKIPTESGLVTPLSANVLDASEVASAVAGHDVVVSAYNPGWTNPNIYAEFLQGAQAIQQGVKQSGVKRFLLVGGAGSLEVAPGVQLIDTPGFPEEYKPGANAAREYLNILKQENDLDWTFVSPAIEMHPGTSGKRTGTYRTSLDTPVFNDHKRSILSVEDLAVAIVDEIEQPQFIKKRFTAAY
ncbi:NAD(P)-dependent oxidoreductase [Dyadobacter luticola]|uniref:NAD(P)-dependent oxidoreductase n=1 Tax=Dyadobacter luticola TaxID=1979387 RepID=A0A5R9L3L2_9BACT|nr:NAD(P)-dependent oxidoreductase [Dyadobacter luticola]TLV02998.1 NAD(P)-dependent oxidoreductase [Dyadobacter luticola]